MKNALAPRRNQSVLQLEDYNRLHDETAGSGIKGLVAFGVIVVATAVGGAGYWAMSSEIDGAVVAPGSFVVEGNRKSVEHLDGGIVRQILVADGDLVDAGDTLIELDSSEIDVDLDVLRSQVGELSVRRARLMAQLQDRDMFDLAFALEHLSMASPDDDWLATFDTQKLLFDAERRRRVAQRELLQQRIQSLQDQVAGLDIQRQSYARQLDITKKELTNLEILLAKGLVAAARVNSRMIEVERLTGVDASLSAQQAQSFNRISELKLARISEETQQNEAISADLVQVEASLATLLPQYEGAQQRRKRVALKAPVSGRVVSLSVFTAGGVVRPGETILEIVPDNQPLLVEARVNTADREKLSIGQPTRVRLSAFDQSDIPEATGKIVDISADSLEDDRTGHFYYTAHVRLDENQNENLRDLDLVPGMPADLFVNTGAKTALTYLAQPLQDRLIRTFIE
ncbi:MAG: HlyD family type I secretion periplasmic adaptor subunit [Pseudomonadota bacterium]